jgi:thiamine biosynthesis lipoprotein
MLGALALGCIAVPAFALASTASKPKSAASPSTLAEASATAATCIREGRAAMGTVLQLQLCGASPAELRALAHTAFAEVEREEAIFSSFRADSDVARLSRRAGQGVVAVSPDLVRILREARYWGEATGGAFDVTVGPLVSLWRTAVQLPSERAIADARARTGLDKLSFGAGGMVALTRTGMSIDLGGIAKGYALDRVRERIARTTTGLESALLEFGSSSVWAIGAPPGGATWNLVLRSPEGDSLALVGLRDQALSVSATFGSAHDIEGRRFGHVIDPRSGRALDRERVGAVIAESATAAEALSKSVLILAEGGLVSLERLPRSEAILFEPGRAPLRTSGWDRAVATERSSS